MFWQEDKGKDQVEVPDAILDLTFTIHCKEIPIGHAWLLWEALQVALPWLAEEPKAGVHQIYIPESGNGWMRPTDPNALMYPSRRSRLVLRLPKERLDDALSLQEQTLALGSYMVKVGEGKVKPLSLITTQTCRYMESFPDETEDQFLQRIANELAKLRIKVRKMLCGKSHDIALPGQTIYTRSIMLAELTVDDAILLQQEGIGAHRNFGCGLFMPSKSISAVSGKE